MRCLLLLLENPAALWYAVLANASIFEEVSMRRCRRGLCLLLLGMVLFHTALAQASAISGQSYETFGQYYKENIDFINYNAGRHLLPMVLASRGDVAGDGRLVYELIGDTLNVTLTTDPTGKIIERCVITLTAADSMEYGSALYNDFAISGYHSYAFLMAMHTDTDPAKRYELVPDTVAGTAAGEGAYTRQLGIYTLTCSREGNAVTLAFQNNRVQAPLAPGEEAAPAEIFPPDEDEGAGLL